MGGFRPALMLALWVAFPSLCFLQEHVGSWAVPPYVGAVIVAMLVSGRWWPISEVWADKRFGWIALACLLGLVIGHVGLHPFEDGRGVGLSSDRDEALEVAVGRLMDGRYPYYRESEVAGPLSVLPGGILLAVPFVLIGKVGLMNAAWLIAFLFIMRREFGSASRALWLLILPLAVSPAAAYEFVSGGDLIANGTSVAIACWCCLHFWSEDKLRPWLAIGSAVFLGVAVASRANFPLICPLVIAWLWRRAGPGRAAICALLAGGVAIGLILGFYFIDQDSFTPFMSRRKLLIGGAPAWTGQAVLGATLLAVLGFGIRLLIARREPSRDACFRACAWVTLVPLAAMILIASVMHGRADFSILHDRFGLMCVPFAILGWGTLQWKRGASFRRPEKGQGTFQVP